MDRVCVWGEGSAHSRSPSFPASSGSFPATPAYINTHTHPHTRTHPLLRGVGQRSTSCTDVLVLSTSSLLPSLLLPRNPFLSCWALPVGRGGKTPLPPVVLRRCHPRLRCSSFLPFCFSGREGRRGVIELTNVYDPSPLHSTLLVALSFSLSVSLFLFPSLSLFPFLSCRVCGSTTLGTTGGWRL